MSQVLDRMRASPASPLVGPGPPDPGDNPQSTTSFAQVTGGNSTCGAVDLVLSVRVVVGYDQPAGTGGYRGMVDDIRITE